MIRGEDLAGTGLPDRRQASKGALRQDMHCLDEISHTAVVSLLSELDTSPCSSKILIRLSIFWVSTDRGISSNSPDIGRSKVRTDRPAASDGLFYIINTCPLQLLRPCLVWLARRKQ